MSVKKINLKINGIDVTVDEGTTILEAARKVGVKISTLCYLKEINAIGACRICVVELKGRPNLVTACVYPCEEGMEVITNSEKVMNARKGTLELILSDHKKECLSCVRNGNCELAELSKEYGCDSNKFDGERKNYDLDTSTKYLVRDNNKCVLCKRCIAVCKTVQDVAVIDSIQRGFNSHIGSPFDMELAEAPCVGCGQCINVCPTGALTEKDDIENVIKALEDPEKHVVVGSAPAVRAALGEEFGYPIGTNVEGQMITSLKMLGFDKVFDVNFAADLTIMEEGYEFINRIQNKGVLPMITSCSPGWIRYIEYYYPELLPHLSTCKSPQQMFGAMVKTYYAEKNNIDPKNIVVVTIMPCTAKKFEITREDQSASGYPDIDYTITTRELARLIKRKGIMFNDLTKSEVDNPLGEGSGAGLIFGTTGGVMEAALRTVKEKLEGKELPQVDFKEVRGMKGIKEAVYNVAGIDVKVAVASGLSNAKDLCEKIKAGKAEYHFIEIMCCPGGCINGGGQPIVDSDVRNNVDYKALRAKALYDGDKKLKLRKSHENSYIQQVYKDYLGEPNSHKAHKILHTTYVKREKY